MLKFGLSIGMFPVVAAGTDNSRVTPAQTKGPFYPIHQQQDKDEDLTIILGNNVQAAGKPITVVGRVMSPEGKPLENTLVEIWQADANGRYRHVRDPNPAPLDSNFQGWGITRTDRQGNYSFKTIVPGAYPAGPGWIRPPHIHFKVVKENFTPLITQMYFPGNRLNNADLILNNLSQKDQQLVISKHMSEGNNKDEYLFNIFLKPNT